MLKTILIATAALAVAAPAFAKTAPKAEAAPKGWENDAPIAYGDLAAKDAMINGSGPKHHMMKKKASKDSSQAGSAEAGKTQ